MVTRHILVIDDDPASLRLAERILRLAGHAVTTASTPELTPAQIARLAPDLIVLDYWYSGEPRALPFLAALRADACTTQIPALLVSAAVHGVTQAQAVLTALGCQVLFKPYEMDALLAAVAGRLQWTSPPSEPAGRHGRRAVHVRDRQGGIGRNGRLTASGARHLSAPAAMTGGRGRHFRREGRRSGG